MPRTLLLFVPTILALALRFAPGAAPEPAAGGGAILTMQKQLFAAIDRGDAEAARAFVASDRKGPGGATSLFLVDSTGAAIRAGDAESARGAIARLAAESKAAGGSFETKITFESADCPSSDLSFAVLEIERVHTLAGKKETRSFRSTSLVRHEESGWKLAHWHVSGGTGTQ